MTRQARFEICHGDDGYWARFRAANGRVMWVTETYRRRQAAEDAVVMLTYNMGSWGPTPEMIEVDERESS